jgi:hypothetical protein
MNGPKTMRKNRRFPLAGEGLPVLPSRIAPSGCMIWFHVTDGVAQQGAGTFRYALQRAEAAKAAHPRAHVGLKLDVRVVDLFGPSPVTANGVTIAGQTGPGTLIETDTTLTLERARVERMVEIVAFQNQPAVLDFYKSASLA